MISCGFLSTTSKYELPKQYHTRPFFKKSERFHVPDKEAQETNRLYFDSQAIGTDGPIHASYAKQYSKTHQLCYDTIINAGIPENRAHHAGSNVGVWTNLNSIDPDDDARSYASLGYYMPNSSRKNLFVLTEALVEEIVLHKENEEWTATGVRFMHDGSHFTASASREVIVSAGSVQSPQLLELSGIGNSEILAGASVDVKVANPNVGENLQDHLSTYLDHVILENCLLISRQCPYQSSKLIPPSKKQAWNPQEPLIATCPSQKQHHRRGSRKLLQKSRNSSDTL